ncbi:MAG: putative toxin-antitoxin system toxin component, PIN family [Proteobacteria bacterium]|nr:putative toxin-antitoxin system toxin component, PIN family [Pseudomonadota bacterium]
MDTNVTIAAFFRDGYPRRVYNLIRDGKLTMLLSKEMEREFMRVLGYSKFGLSPQEVIPFVTNLRNCAELLETKSKISLITVDPTDNIFLECAIDGKADYIISGDRHLLNLHIYEGIEIIKPKEYLAREGFLIES